ncbi:hypothetical protein ACQRD4_09825 [Streptococcus hyointestinalis]|uniref:hypothetical protein n=1 Tax=Streptococcus hyointestinalis TaxID=1337 RepID=UPI003D04DA31
MANQNNLIPLSNRSEKELREMRRKGALAATKSKRRKAELRQAFQTLLTAEVNNEQMKELLINLGYEPTNEMALALVVLQKALNGDIRAFGQIKEIIDKDDD